MPAALSLAIEVLVADGNIGHDAVYTPAGGAPVLMRAVARRADDITSFGDARLWSETTRMDLRVAEVPLRHRTRRLGADRQLEAGAAVTMGIMALVAQAERGAIYRRTKEPLGRVRRSSSIAASSRHGRARN